MQGKRSIRTRGAVIAAAAAIGAMGVSGTALAVSGSGGSGATSAQAAAQEQRDQFQADVASALGVSTTRLEAALKDARLKQVDRAVAAGRLTQAQADELKQSIESGEAPTGFGPGPGQGGPGGHHGPPGLDAAAAYLGLTATELRSQLATGSSLADVAKAEGASVDGLEQALLADAKEHLDAAVEAGRITADQRDAMLDGLAERIGDMVERTPPAGGSQGAGLAPAGAGLPL